MLYKWPNKTIWVEIAYHTKHYTLHSFHPDTGVCSGYVDFTMQNFIVQ